MRRGGAGAYKWPNDRIFSDEELDERLLRLGMESPCRPRPTSPSSDDAIMPSPQEVFNAPTDAAAQHECPHPF